MRFSQLSVCLFSGSYGKSDLLRVRYPYVATEVLCSDIWSIVETCVNQQEHLLAPFWETVLDKSPEDMKTQMVMAAHFAKINAVFISKKPAEVNLSPYLLSSACECRASCSDARLHPITTLSGRKTTTTHRNTFFCGPPCSYNTNG